MSRILVRACAIGAAAAVTAAVVVVVLAWLLANGHALPGIMWLVFVVAAGISFADSVFGRRRTGENQ